MPNREILFLVGEGTNTESDGARQEVDATLQSLVDKNIISADDPCSTHFLETSQLLKNHFGNQITIITIYGEGVDPETKTYNIN